VVHDGRKIVSKLYESYASAVQQRDRLAAAAPSLPARTPEPPLTFCRLTRACGLVTRRRGGASSLYEAPRSRISRLGLFELRYVLRRWALAPSGALLAVLLAASDRALRDPENHRERMAFFVLAVSFITLADLLAAMLAGEAFWHRNRKDWVPTLVRWAAYLVLALATAGSVNRPGFHRGSSS